MGGTARLIDNGILRKTSGTGNRDARYFGRHYSVKMAYTSLPLEEDQHLEDKTPIVECCLIPRHDIRTINKESNGGLV